LDRFSEDEPMETLQPVASAEDVIWLQETARKIYVSEPINNTFLICAKDAIASRRRVGYFATCNADASPSCQGTALLEGRGFVVPDDVQQLFQPVLQHRLLIRAEGRVQGIDSAQILEVVLRQVPVPTRQ